jgi:hypothetical protein
MAAWRIARKQTVKPEFTNAARKRMTHCMLRAGYMLPGSRKSIKFAVCHLDSDLIM